MKNFLLRLWKDEEGAEFVEWVIIVALIAVAAIAVYGSLETTLGAKLNEVIANIKTS
jgi:pilus assembly protein Flp/PilA